MFGNLFSKLRKTVLVMEDDEALRLALVDKLSNAGFNVIQAEDGGEGLRLAIAKRPRVILLDLMMPTTDGVQVLDELRKSEWGKDVPVIIISNLLEDEDIVKRYRVFGYVVKSDWKIEDVVKKVNAAMGQG